MNTEFSGRGLSFRLLMMAAKIARSSEVSAVLIPPARLINYIIVTQIECEILL